MALEYELTYAGIPFVTDSAQSFRPPVQKGQAYTDPNFSPPQDQEPLADLLEELDRLQGWDLLDDFSPPDDSKGRNLDAIAAKSPTLPKPTPRLKLYDFWYPNTATRWSVFRGLATSTMAKQMLAATQGVKPATFTIKSNPIAPNHPDSDVASYTVSTSMYLLSARPLREHGGGFDGLYLITLVDERYNWQQSNAPVTLHFHQLQSWDNLLTELANVLGITLSYSSIPAAYSYPEPDSQLWTSYDSAGALLDAIAYNIGRTVVRNLDGTYTLQTYLEAQSQVNYNRGSASTVTRLAGGDLFYSGTQLPIGNLFNAKNAVVPSQVTVTFPKYVQGDDPVPHFVNSRYAPQRPSAWYEDSYGNSYPVTIPIASGGPLASGLAGGPTHTIHNTAKALYSGEQQAVSGGAPVNASGLNSLATQIAQDFYGWKLGAALDEVYPGTYKWAPEGMHDIVWTYSARRRIACTRVIKSPWNQVVRDMQHSAYPLPGFTNVPRGVGGPSVALTIRDSISSGGKSTLAQTLGTFDTNAVLANGKVFPQTRRWKGQVDSEIIEFEGLSGGDSAQVVFRGIDGTVQAFHDNGAAITQLLPNTNYGTNLLTFGKGFTAYPNAWTSGGISESLVDVDLSTIPSNTTQNFYATMNMFGEMNFYGQFFMYGLMMFNYTNISLTNFVGLLTLTGDTPKLRIEATDKVYIYGIANPDGAEPEPGQILIIWNIGPDDVELFHLDSSVADEFQIIVPNHEDFIIYPDYAVILEYDGDSKKWRFDTPGLFTGINDGGATGLVPSPNSAIYETDYLAADRTWKQFPEGPAEVTWYQGYVQPYQSQPVKQFKRGIRGQSPSSKGSTSGDTKTPPLDDFDESSGYLTSGIPSVGLGVLDRSGSANNYEQYPKLTFSAQDLSGNTQDANTVKYQTAIPILKPVDGALLIGGGGDGYAVNTLTQGDNIGILNESGNIIIGCNIVTSGLLSGLLSGASPEGPGEVTWFSGFFKPAAIPSGIDPVSGPWGYLEWSGNLHPKVPSIGMGVIDPIRLQDRAGNPQQYPQLTLAAQDISGNTYDASTNAVRYAVTVPILAPTDGQLLIGGGTGSSGGGYAVNTLTAGTNVTITNASGSITIAASLSGVNNDTAPFVGTGSDTVGTTVTSPTYVDVVQLAINTKGGPIYTSYFTTALLASGDQAYWRLLLDGVAQVIDPIAILGVAGLDGWYMTVSFGTTIQGISSGAHTLKVQSHIFVSGPLTLLPQTLNAMEFLNGSPP